MTYHPINEYTLHVDSDNDKLARLLHKKVQHVPFDKIILQHPTCTQILLSNVAGRNNDHRGSDHCRVHLAMKKYQMLTLPCSLSDLAQACYRIKSHKFDKWYELYSGITSIKISNNCMYVGVNFDHGS